LAWEEAARANKRIIGAGVWLNAWSRGSHCKAVSSGRRHFTENGVVA